jgi:DtxR family transcriptional regulator, Mn-dependent transcriptional regulator
MIDNSLSQVEIEYLECIYQLQMLIKRGGMTTTQLAKMMDHKLPTVTATLKRLNKKSAIIYKPYQGYKLTDFGKKMAVQRIRAERIWQYFLVMELGYTWLEVMLQQRFTLQNDILLIARLEASMDFPKICPFGNPIPEASGYMQALEWQILNDASPQNEYQIIGVNTHDPNILEQFSRLNIRFLQEFRLSSKALMEPYHQLEINKSKFNLPAELGKYLLIRSHKIKKGFFG